jgi:hypothetical protein
MENNNINNNINIDIIANDDVISNNNVGNDNMSNEDDKINHTNDNGTVNDGTIDNGTINDDENNDNEDIIEDMIEDTNANDIDNGNDDNEDTNANDIDNGNDDNDNEDTNANVNANVNANANQIDGEDNTANIFHQIFQIPENVLNELVENKRCEIMNWAYANTMNLDDNIIKFIDYCYLKNLQYDDEPIEAIRYTIRTIFAEGIDYELKNLVSNIFSYGMIGINYVFNENIGILNELLSLELKRLLRRGIVLNMVSQMITNGVPNGIPNGIPNGFGPMEDIKLILTKEELEKIPISTYKEISPELREKNTSCSVCRDEYNENDSVRTLNCGHIFHSDCVDNWLTNHSHKCPYCRQTTGNYKPNI